MADTKDHTSLWADYRTDLENSRTEPPTYDFTTLVALDRATVVAGGGSSTDFTTQYQFYLNAQYGFP